MQCPWQPVQIEKLVVLVLFWILQVLVQSSPPLKHVQW